MTHPDASLIRELIEAHGAALTLYARQWCRTPEDALQEALIELLRQKPRPQNPAGWLYTTVRRRAMNLARGEDRRRKHQHQAACDRETWFVADHDRADELDYEVLLKSLPPSDREIVVARIWGERSFAEIAELVGQSTSTVHRRYQQALEALESMIQVSEQGTSDHGRPQDESRIPLGG